MVWSLFRRRSGAGVSEAQVPVLAGRYRLGARIGVSGSGQVREAVDLRTGTILAAKLVPLPSQLTLERRADWLARLQREVSVAQRLTHPDILRVLDAGIDAAHVWMVTERVHGHDLSRYGQRSRLLPEPVVLRIGARIASALAFAHGVGVIHRDLKPANVLVDLSSDTVKLADFGAARVDESQLTRTGMVPGTPMYMSPEQLAGTTATADSDAYALGVMMFELLSGTRPHQASTLGELLRAMAVQPAPSLGRVRPDLPTTMISLIDRLLAADPADRPRDLSAWAGNVTALVTIIERVLETRQTAPA